MEEIETPTEKIQEDIQENAHHAKENWIGRVALSSALVAVLAAISALLAGHHSNEAIIAQVRSSDHWAHYQAKGIKASVLGSKLELLKEMGKTTSTKDVEKMEEYKKEQEEISNQAKEKHEEAEHHLRVHETLAKSVTLYQIAIAISAIAVLVRRRRFWYLGMGFGFIATFFFIQGLLLG